MHVGEVSTLILLLFVFYFLLLSYYVPTTKLVFTFLTTLVLWLIQYEAQFFFLSCS